MWIDLHSVILAKCGRRSKDQGLPVAGVGRRRIGRALEHAQGGETIRADRAMMDVCLHRQILM